MSSESSYNNMIAAPSHKINNSNKFLSDSSNTSNSPSHSSNSESHSKNSDPPFEDMARAQTLPLNSKAKNEAIRNVPMRTLGSYGYSPPPKTRASPPTDMGAPSSARNKRQSDDNIDGKL